MISWTISQIQDPGFPHEKSYIGPGKDPQHRPTEATPVTSSYWIYKEVPFQTPQLPGWTAATGRTHHTRENMTSEQTNQTRP